MLIIKSNFYNNIPNFGGDALQKDRKDLSLL